MEIGNIVKFKMFLPGNLAEIAGDDMALVQYRLAVAVQGEPGEITSIQGDGKLSIQFPVYGAECVGISPEVLYLADESDPSTADGAYTPPAPKKFLGIF